MTEQKFGHIAREAVKHPYVIRDLSTWTLSIRSGRVYTKATVAME